MSGPYQPTQRKASKTAVLWAGDDMRLGRCRTYDSPYCMATRTSNHAMERTADRCMTRLKEELRIMKQAIRALVRRRSSYSR
jgi:hypothetical protein